MPAAMMKITSSPARSSIYTAIKDLEEGNANKGEYLTDKSLEKLG